MERELRYQEDMIYQLQDYIHTYKSHLGACRAENQSLRQTSASLPRISNGTPADGTPADGNGQPMEVVPVEPENGQNGGQNGELQPPQIQLPPLSANQPHQPTAVDDLFEVVELDQQNRPVQREPLQPTEIAAETEDKIAPASYDSPLAVDNPADHEAVATLSVNPDRTAAYGQNPQRDTEGIQVWLEPRGASGRIVRASGTATIAVLDPRQSRSAKPLARWQVKSADLRRFQTRDGIRLKLRWPQEAPQQSEVLVFVRMITSDGLWIYADQFVSLDSQLIDAAAPVIAARRPDKPPTVSPTARDQSQDKPVPKAARRASTEAVLEKKSKKTAAVPEKKSWSAATPRKPQPQVDQAGSGDAPQPQPTAPQAEPPSESVPQEATAPQAAPAAQPKQPPPTPPEPKAAPQRSRQRPQWAPVR
jgi:hypothetical protein